MKINQSAKYGLSIFVLVLALIYLLFSSLGIEKFSGASLQGYALGFSIDIVSAIYIAVFILISIMTLRVARKKF